MLHLLILKIDDIAVRQNCNFHFFASFKQFVGVDLQSHFLVEVADVLFEELTLLFLGLFFVEEVQKEGGGELVEAGGAGWGAEVRLQGRAEVGGLLGGEGAARHSHQKWLLLLRHYIQDNVNYHIGAAMNG
jgi:hypothetical protein